MSDLETDKSAGPSPPAGIGLVAVQLPGSREALHPEEASPSADLAEIINVLVEENAKLREAVAARDTFLAVAAHELRNPMTPIVGRVERMRRMMSKPGFDPEKIQKGFERRCRVKPV